MNFGACFARDDQVKRAGNAAFRNDDGAKIGALHDAFIVAQAETTRRIPFSRFVVALNTACEKYWLDIVCKTNLPLAAGKQNTKREETKF